VPDKSLLQITTSFGGFFATCAAMYAVIEVSYLVALAFAPLAAGFLVRIFIIQHDCGHRSFFRARRANDIVGMACSLLTLTPYAPWRRQHAGHHGIWNDLDRRQSGADIYSSCLTVAEYRASSRGRRSWYRMTRHPFVANLMLPPLIFILLYRLPFDMPKSWRQERRAVHLTTLAVVATLGGLGLVLGYGHVVAVQLTVSVLASIFGVWLFSVQHRGERVRWARHGAWNPTSAALESSTYLFLPPVLQWFTGNIGFHHVHHLNPRVPNYRLQECHNLIAARCDVPKISFRESLRALRFVLWDVERDKMVTFREAAPIAMPSSCSASVVSCAAYPLGRFVPLFFRALFRQRGVRDLGIRRDAVISNSEFNMNPIESWETEGGALVDHIPGDPSTSNSASTSVNSPKNSGTRTTASRYPKFQNDRAVSEIRIGTREFKCIGVSPPHDHPHVYIDMGDEDTIPCPYCATWYRFDPQLAPFESEPRGSIFIDPEEV
jgi:omega-6 fatty acid desaturase (delta-12 desaturase)